MSTTSTTQDSARAGAAPDQGNRTERLREVAGWAGFGLLLGTVPTAFLVLRRLEGSGFGPELLVPAEGRGVWQIPVLIAVVVAVSLLRRDRREPNPNPDPDPEGPVTPGFPFLLGSALVVLLLVLWTHLPRASFVFTAGLFDVGYGVRPAEAALWGIGLPPLLGLVLLLVSHRWPRTRTRSRRWWLTPLAVGASLALLADPAVRALSEHVPTRHSVLDGSPADPAPYPASVERLGWEWRPPEGTAVADVERGPLGPVVATTDGVFGLDGATGGELWSYRRPRGDVLVTLHPGADRAQVILRSRESLGRGIPAEDPLRGGDVVLLDTATGGVVDAFETDTVASRNAHDHSLPGLRLSIRDDYDGVGLGVRAEGGTDHLWWFTLEDEPGAVEDGMVCGTDELRLRSDTWGENLLVQGDQLLLSYRCADPADFEDEREAREHLDRDDDRFVSHLLALDLYTGEENWRRTWDASDGATSSWVALSDGGPALNPGAAPAVVVWSLVERAHVVLDAEDGSDVMVADPDGLLSTVAHADTGGAVTARTERGTDHQGAERDDTVLERLDPSGEVVEVVRLPAPDRTGGHTDAPTGSPVALTGGAALAFVGVEEARNRGDLSLTTAPFRSSDPGPGEPTTGVASLVGGKERWKYQLKWEASWPRAEVVPGAVVSYLSEEGSAVYGWLP
ncbi:hypothetical protein [Nocardiopsis eucommiae]|uniref:hypothetical protein n=1 Tax=Nocardiopsis eucommiae TaxID=2831970 RepID=UPI003D73D767